MSLELPGKARDNVCIMTLPGNLFLLVWPRMLSLVLLGSVLLAPMSVFALTSIRGELGPGIEYRRLETRFGDIQGEVCNQRDEPVDEVAVLFVGEDFQRRLLWHAVVDIAGLGSSRCLRFRRSPDDFEQPFRVLGVAVELHREPFLVAGNLNLPLQVRRPVVRNRQLRSEFCNRSGVTLEDASLNLFGLSGHGDMVWRQNFPVVQLGHGHCLDLEADLDDSRLVRSVLFNVLDVGPPKPTKQGEIEPGLEYRRLRVTVGRLRGEVCNLLPTETGELMLKVYALRENRTEAWSQSLFLPSIPAGECRLINEKIIEQSIRPSAWRFRLWAL